MSKITLASAATTLLLLSGCAAGPYGGTGQYPANQASGWGMPQTGAIQGQTGTITNAAGQAMGMPSYPTPAAGQAPSLVDFIAAQLGISPQQAAGGAGAIFGLAQQRMSPTDFGQVSNAVPGMDGLLGAAPRQAVTNPGMLGGGGALLGGQAGTLGALVGSFQSLGMSPNLITQFVPLMLNYVQQSGGVGAMNLLQGALQ